MNLLDSILNARSGGVVNQLASQFGLREAERAFWECWRRFLIAMVTGPLPTTSLVQYLDSLRN